MFVSQALLLDPHHTKARYRLAQALQGQGKLAKAFEEVTVLRQRNPEVNNFQIHLRFFGGSAYVIELLAITNFFIN